MAHGWGYGVAMKTPDPYNKMFYHFLEANTSLLPVIPVLSAVRDHVMPTPVYEPAPGCLLQTAYDCHRSLDDNDPIFIRDTVYVITRTAGRPFFFAQARKSVLEQIYPKIVHIIGTDDPAISPYLGTIRHTVLNSSYGEFNRFEPCDVCHADPKKGCGNAPSLDHPIERELFLSCYCNTSYPMNKYMKLLQDEVTAPGWVVYLDDDNLFLKPSAIAEMVSSAHSRDDLVVWKSMLDRQTPNDEHFNSRNLVKGDVDSSMFTFHSEHLGLTRWENRRCGDFWTVDSLKRALFVRWIDRSFTGANPLRASLGGLGARREHIEKVTVLITAYSTDGYRILWLQNTLSKYCDLSFHEVIDRIIVVWNNPEMSPPDLNICDAVQVLHQTKNSLNNRWIATLPYIRTDAILNLDDDVFINYDGLACLLGYWISFKGTRLVGHFARVDENGKYIMSELLNKEAYSMLLPRVLLLSRKWLEAYRDADEQHRSYVDTQEAHCDDILLNIIVSTISRAAPFRVQLPLDALDDYFAACATSRRLETGGLALQTDRTAKRSECLSWFFDQFHTKELKRSSEVGVCGGKGVRLKITTTPEFERYSKGKRQFTCDESFKLS
jgi:hypothetical protein